MTDLRGLQGAGQEAGSPSGSGWSLPDPSTGVPVPGRPLTCRAVLRRRLGGRVVTVRIVLVRLAVRHPTEVVVTVGLLEAAHRCVGHLVREPVAAPGVRRSRRRHGVGGRPLVPGRTRQLQRGQDLHETAQGALQRTGQGVRRRCTDQAGRRRGLQGYAPWQPSVQTFS